jgi:uncharacterized protein YwqG
MPDLPADVPWPWRPALSGRSVFADHADRPWPLTFLAQIDLAETHSAGGLEGFPSSGRLLFFCDPILEPWGWSSDDKSCASVIFFTEETDRVARRWPKLTPSIFEEHRAVVSLLERSRKTMKRSK